MDDRPGSPEIDVVRNGDKSQRLRQGSERFYNEPTSLRAANENGANRLAANTNIRAKQKVETVNLRVRNMGIITVKKEPESDDDDKGSFSLSSLLEECDFEKTPRRNNRSKSPTSFGTARSKSLESTRPSGPAQEKPRQRLENVISSLKSGRAVSRPLNVPVAPQMFSATPTPPKIYGPPVNVPVGGIGPQIVDVRSLASVVRPTTTHATVPVKQRLPGRPPYVGHQQKCATSSAPIVPQMPGTQRNVATATAAETIRTKPVNIRFVLPANVPFNTEQFQQVLQATLASLSTQSKAIEPDQLQRAIQAALTSVTKSTVAFNPDQLQQAIQNSLESIATSTPIPQAAETPLSPETVYLPKTTQRQPQTIAPKPPSLPVQPLVIRVDSGNFQKKKPSSGNATENHLPSLPSSSSPVTVSMATVTKNIDSRPTVNANNTNQSTSEVPAISSSHLSSARDALVKALQKSRTLNNPHSLTSTMVSSPGSITDACTTQDSFDQDTVYSSPPSSPLLPMTEAPASCSEVETASTTITTSVGPAETVVTSVTSVESTPQAAVPPVSSAGLPPQATSSAPSVTSVAPASPAASPAERGASLVTSVVSTLQASVSSVTLVGPALPAERGASLVTSASSVPSGTSVGLTPPAERGASSETSAVSTAQASVPSVTLAGPAPQATRGASSVASVTPTLPAERGAYSVASTVSIPQVTRDTSTVTSAISTLQGGAPSVASPKSAPQAAIGVPSVVIDPWTKQINNSPLPNRTQTSSVPVHSTTSSAPVSNINLQISVPVNISENKKTSVSKNKAPPTGCGCCSHCKGAPASNDLYMCYFKGCGNVYQKESGLRKHHYFYPNHKPRIPLENATHSVEYFLPDDLGPTHRNARLRELFRRISIEEIKEHVMFRSAKFISLFELLEAKSMRAQPTRGQATISAFKMFSEFERLRKEVESRLLELILLPQGRAAKCEKKGEGKSSAGAKEADTTEAAKQQKKDAPSVVIISDDKKTESSEGQPTKVPSANDGSSLTSKKTVETICIDPQPEKATATPTAPPKKDGGIPATEVSKSSDSSSVEKVTEESIQKSSEFVAATKQSSSTAQYLGEGGKGIQPDEPSDSKPPKDMAAGNSVTSSTKDSVSDSDEIPKKDVIEAGSDASANQSGDVVMIDAEQNSEKSNKENPTASQHANAELEKASTGEEKQSLATSGKENSQEQTGKQPSIVIEGNKGEVEEVEKTGSEPVEKDKDESLDTGKAMDKMSSDCNKEKGPVVVNVEEHRSDAQADVDKCKTGEVNEEKGSDGKTAAGSDKQSPQVAMPTDKDDRSEIGKNKENGDDPVNEISKSSKTPAESTAQSTAEKISQEPGAVSGKVDQISRESSSSRKSSCSAEVDMTIDGSTDAQKAAQNGTPTLKQKLSKVLAEITIEDEEEIDENNLLEFGLPFAVKWGKIIKTVRTLEARKIARKENYTEQDMKQFIYNKPKEAAVAVIAADCHAHPSFFRAYVMPALLDKHIDDFGLFGKKLLSRLHLSRKKYVDALRSSIGIEFSKIVGINIFPTFKRIQDTCKNVKAMTPQEKAKRNLVLVLMPEDEREIPDDEDEAPAATNTTSRMGSINPVQVRGNTVQHSVVRAVGSTVQNASGQSNDLRKRPSTTVIAQNDNSKKQRLDNSDAQKDASQTNKTQAGSSEKAGVQTKVADKGQKADGTPSSGKNATGDRRQPGAISKSGTNQAGPADKRKDTTSSLGKSTASGSTVSTIHVSTVQSKPSTISEHAYSKTPSAANTASVIPKKATIFTSGGKVGTSPLPFSSAKGSPLYLVPVEKLSPKLVEQFINQGKGDGVKTRSASSGNKGKQPKQSSHVLVLIPSSTPNGSPTIQTLTSEDQLKSDGDKKPLLLLPADKVPKSMASQSPTVRRKMVITMVAPSSGSGNAGQSTAQTVTTLSPSLAGGQQNDSASSSLPVQGPVMSTIESNRDSNASTATVSNSSAVSMATSEDVVGGDPKPTKELVDSNITSLVSVVNNTSALNSSTKDGMAESAKSVSSTEPIDVDQLDSAVSKESDLKDSEETLPSESSEVNVTSTPASNKPIDPSEKSQRSASSAESGVVDSQDNGGLDVLGSSLLPSDITLDNLLKDITGDGSEIEANDMPPLDVSEIISSFGDMPLESDISTTDSVSHDTVTLASQGTSVDSDSETRSCSQGSAIEDDGSPNTRRQSPRRAPAPSKSTPVSSLADVSSPNTSGGSREDSDTEDGGPPRKLRKTLTRTSVRSSPQVTFVPDKEVPGKSSHELPSRNKGRKQ